jgi:hypothetical protein
MNTNGHLCNGTSSNDGANTVTEYLSITSQKTQSCSNNNNNNFSTNQTKQTVATPNINCMCNCSNSSNSQSVVQTPVYKPQSANQILSNPTRTNNNNNTIMSFYTQLANEYNHPSRRQHHANSPTRVDKALFNDNPDLCSAHHDNNCKNQCIQRRDLDQTIQQNFGDIIRTIKNTIEKNEIRLREKERRDIVQNEWSDVAMILDRLLCYFFSISTLVTCALIFLNSPHFLSSW